MYRITLPVVAHRLFGRFHRPETVWRADEPEAVGPASDLLMADDPFVLSQAPRDDASDDALEPLDRVAYVAPGTRRTIDEIRDLFDGGGRAETTGPEGINHIWEQADIRFRLTAIVDHAIRTDHAIAMPNEMGVYARWFNQTGVVNFYFVREYVCGHGIAAFSPWPDDPTKLPAFAAVEDWEEYGHERTMYAMCVDTAAHELGHLLTLRHEEDLDNLMGPTISSGHTALRPIQVMVARTHARRYLPGVRRLRAVSSRFQALYSSADADPMTARAYLGERWRFDE